MTTEFILSPVSITAVGGYPHLSRRIAAEISMITSAWCSLYMALQLFVGPWPLFQFLNFYTVDRTPWTGDQPVARPLPIHRTAQTQNKRTQPQVGFEPTIPVF
jgi:hypothetical protein